MGYHGDLAVGSFEVHNWHFVTLCGHAFQSRPSRSSYATSFPRHYKKCCTAAASLRPSELEMQLLGSLEATELEAEAAGEACQPRGRRNQTHNKETKADEAGVAVRGPSVDLGTKEPRGWANSTDLSIVSLFFSSVEHYKHHWFPEKPCKGSGYRCIRINHKMDPLIGQAAQRIGLSSQELFRLLPSELTLWVDPYEVSYRIGEDGSICVLYEASPAGGSTQNSTNVQMVDSRISCKEELLLGRTSPSKNYNMMTVSG
uniref:protein BTG1 n=1 Tax=Ictidomys tridecemlineatus TaxID=43179 RepID=UPI001A9EFFA5|nr:protein BTG1 [Ictidomys tridecemlineatus]